MNATPSSKWAECPQCDPCNPELDEDGRPYTCYFCCDTGRVLRSVLEAEERERAAYLREHPPLPTYTARRQPAPAAAWAGDDDIPF